MEPCKVNKIPLKQKNTVGTYYHTFWGDYKWELRMGSKPGSNFSVISSILFFLY